MRSKPDGYTLYLGYGSGHDMVMPHLQKMPYDPYKDLVAVARVSVHSVVVVTGAKSEFNSLKGHDRVGQEGEQADHLLRVDEGRCAGHHHHRASAKAAGDQHRDRAVRGRRRRRDDAGRRTRDDRRPGTLRRSCPTSRPAASSRWRWPCPSATRRCRISPPSRSWGSTSHVGLRQGDRRRRPGRPRRWSSILTPPSRRLRGRGIQEDHGGPRPADHVPERCRLR